MARVFRKPEPEEPEDLIVFVELEHSLTPEEQNIIAWRDDVLQQAGVSSKAAAILAGSLSVDLHQTVALKRKGCSDTLLIEIMR